MAKDKIPEELNHGAIRGENGAVIVGGDNYFGVPTAAFPDQKNFTVQVTVSFPELAADTSLNALLKQRKDGEDTGLGLTCIHGATGNWQVSRPILNGRHIGGDPDEVRAQQGLYLQRCRAGLKCRVLFGRCAGQPALHASAAERRTDGLGKNFCPVKSRFQLRKFRRSRCTAPISITGLQRKSRARRLAARLPGKIG